jgi:hypothetical protein
LTPNRNARDVRNGGEGSLEPVSGTNTSPIALIFNCGPFRKDAATPNVRIVWIRPTTRATALHEKLMQTNRAVLAEVIAAVPAAEQKNVQESVRLLLDSAERVLRLQPPGETAACGRRRKRR